MPNQLSAPFRMGYHAAWDTEVGGQLLDSASIRLHPNLNARPPGRRDSVGLGEAPGRKQKRVNYFMPGPDRTVTGRQLVKLPRGA